MSTAAARRYSDTEKASLTARALALLQQGHSRTEAAQTLGVGKSTLYDWLAPRQAEAVQAQRAASMQLLDDNSASLHTRLQALLYSRNYLWECWLERIQRLDADAMRILSAVDRLDRMLDRLTGGLYFLPRPSRARKGAAARGDFPADFPAEIPADQPPLSETDSQIPEEQVFEHEEAVDAVSENSGAIPAALPPAIPRPTTRQQRRQQKRAPIPPGWGTKRGVR